MLKIVVGGAIDKQKLAEELKKISAGQAEITIKSDIEAAMAVKSGKADYYFGACATGGGGALAMAIAMLTKAKCATVSMPGKAPDEATVKAAIDAGAVAFGFTNDHIERAVALIWPHIAR